VLIISFLISYISIGLISTGLFNYKSYNIYLLYLINTKDIVKD